MNRSVKEIGKMHFIDSKCFRSWNDFNDGPKSDRFLAKNDVLKVIYSIVVNELLVNLTCGIKWHEEHFGIFQPSIKRFF